ncbi:MAPEG family protein [Pseudomonas sp. DTU_2021_1001937_2_SI_NGA_ILE_001]|uniref:MAPEG family protein n=1 Tax=Pseudomonas sp. DTU_2021_1001937_2_SI_NGA_ILE_001 TaxID=3077589 RepID=UPI0028FC28BB|nr:MAPEG family protein [Pseudomonas sp. DTU_2021_1001937_2_SI_NGA_ILE_001]WNW12267.1 MAPEG family protein [Pseudomonas sp. DTU_2021_1001937_2_SI_NGA_ILE_001]
MTVAFACVWIALTLPYLCAIIARAASGCFRLHHNRDPRAFLDNLQGLAKRAHNAQLNGFETNPAFACAILAAWLAGHVQAGVINLMAVAYVISRVLFITFYLADLHRLRSLAWLAGFGLITALFGLAILPPGWTW